MHACMHACMHASIHPSIHPSIRTYVHVDTHIYIYIYTPCIYTPCIYIYIYTPRKYIRRRPSNFPWQWVRVPGLGLCTLMAFFLTTHRMATRNPWGKICGQARGYEPTLYIYRVIRKWESLFIKPFTNHKTFDLFHCSNRFQPIKFRCYYES